MHWLRTFFGNYGWLRNLSIILILIPSIRQTITKILARDLERIGLEINVMLSKNTCML